MKLYVLYASLDHQHILRMNYQLHKLAPKDTVECFWNAFFEAEFIWSKYIKT